MAAAHEYYSKRSRKVSSSQTSLPEQLQNGTKDSANRSLLFLPATTYSTSRTDAADADNPPLSPDSYYHQYQTQHAESTGASLRQGALRTFDLENLGSAQSTSVLEDRYATYRRGLPTGHTDINRPHMSSPGLRGRKSSVKNLVEQYNASSNEELPPVPTNPASRNGSRNVSPVLNSQAHFQQPDVSRQLFNSTVTISRPDPNNRLATRSSAGYHVGAGRKSGSTEMLVHNHRPLFGEVVPSSAAIPLPGYGIQSLRKRSGSEGSPLPSPGFASFQTHEHASRNNYNAITADQANFMLAPTLYGASTNTLQHRRANSESPLTPTKTTSETAPSSHVYAPIHGRNNSSASRIPVSVRRGSVNSDLDDRNASPFSTPKASSASMVGQQKQRSPRRGARSPPAIQSPGQRGKTVNVNQVPKSPSLRANIIVPPPKISPPLRSSRPRLPVSSASTTASRAKMAEKISAIQKMNDEKRQAHKRVARPPELSDIDLKARRMRITQALSRSLEGQDLRGNKVPVRRRDLSTSRTASPTLSAKSDISGVREDIPAVVIDKTATAGDVLDDDTPTEGIRRQERAFSHNALDAMQGYPRHLSAMDDSPTLGNGLEYLNRPTPLQTDLQRHNDHSNEPSSAVTEGTMIDPDPQDDFRDDHSDQSVLKQIHSLRSKGSLRDSAYDAFSDRGDQESVQLVLRDTTYFDDGEAGGKRFKVPNVADDSIAQDDDRSGEPRSSWISSLKSDQELDDGFAQLADDVVLVSPEEQALSYGPDYDNPEASVRSTMASDAYTIVNIVLQQHSTSGIVDQQFVDDVYQRILEDSPFEDENNLSADRIEQICLREIQDREESWSKPAVNSRFTSSNTSQEEEEIETPIENTKQEDKGHREVNDWSFTAKEASRLAPPLAYKGHRYKSSLDSAEDWADTSPSISDWMRYAADDGTSQANQVDTVPSTNSIEGNTAFAKGHSLVNQKKLAATTQDESEDSDMYSAPRPRPPSHAPPPLPAEDRPSTEDGSFGSAIIQRPQIPRRVTSISQISRNTSRGRQSPSISAPVLGKVSIDDTLTPEQRRLKQRKNVIKELVDTEFSYEKDLRVLCDIYKQTSSVALSEEDIRVLFGNVEEVQTFSKDFLMLLKSLAKPTYTMERQDRKKEKPPEKAELQVRSRSSSSTIASTKAAENDSPTVEKDRETRIGQAFEASLTDMEKVYTEYIKNRHAANLRLEAVQKSQGAREWLKECKENSSDITNAWNLDALLVKPVQRITKYPLLLKELVDATSEEHPDLPFLRKALLGVTEVNIRINDVKKHAELVDQVLNRKRKDSDVRAGLSKAFGRRAEKLKQHVGMTELYEDSKYNEIKIHYDNNIVQLMVVGNDCSSYGRSITKWVNKMVEIAAAAEAWVDVKSSHRQEAESRIRQFAMVVRGISTIALPDHLEQLNARVLTPMQQAVDMMTKFKTDPKGLLQKREKRMIDYAQIKSKKDRGEKLDKKTIERMEQSEALNVEAKQRMRKLVTATAKLVQACQISLIQMQTTWQNMVKQKLSAAMGISLDHLDVEDIKKEWQLDFDYQEALALSLGICNGSLLAEAVNMMSFQASATTLNGEESPRQASFTSTSKRSVSLASENSYPPIPEYDPRTSGTYAYQYHEHHVPYANPRGRAQSTTSARYGRTPEIPQHGSASDGFGNFTRQDSGPVPRLSIDTPSPLFGVLQPEANSRRPMSSATFFSASGTPPPQQQHQRQHHHQSTTSSIFSSAMPMSDSPVVERFTEHATSTDPDVLFTAASVYEFNIDRSRREAGFPYLTYVTGEIFDVIGERGELWLAKNQDDPQRQIGWIWNKHFAKLAE